MQTDATCDRLPGGFPWAFVLAVALVGLVEAAIRRADPTSVIPYALEEAEYHAVAGYVDAFGPADICFVGSSRTREAIVAPEVRRRCEVILKNPVTVANYACGGARADECNAITQYIMKRGTPRLILYGVSPRHLQGERTYREQIALLWNLDDWWDLYSHDENRVGDLLPIVIRNKLGSYYRTLKYRLAPGSWLKNHFDAIKLRNEPPLSPAGLFRQSHSPCPVRGEVTRWHRLRERRLSARPVSNEHVRRFVARLHQDARGGLLEERTKQVELMIRRCREAGTQLVLFELPNPDIFRKHLSEELERDFRARIQALADAGGATFVTFEQLDLEVTDADFAEEAHMHYEGALRFTAALVDRVILPRLGATGSPLQGGGLPARVHWRTSRQWHPEKPLEPAYAATTTASPAGN